MNSASSLLELIRSLKPSEKRQFRLRSAGAGQSPSYLRLYDFLATHPTGDDAAIRQAFAGEAFTKQLPVAKNYLYHQLLDCLCAYDSSKTPSLSLAHRLAEVEVLFRRGLHAAALDQAVQGTAQAQALDLPLKELEFLRWQMRLLRIGGGPGLLDSLHALHARERRALTRTQDEQALIELHDEAYGLLLTRASIVPSALEERCAVIFAHPLLDESLFPDRNFDARIMAGYIRLWASTLAADRVGQWLAYRNMLPIWEGNEHRRRLEPERYLRTLSGYLQCGLNAGKLEDAAATIAKLRRLLKLHAELQVTDGFRIYFAEWNYLMDLYKVKEASLVVPELLASLERNTNATPQVRASVESNLAIMWFQLQKWQASKDQIEALLRKHGAYVTKRLILVLRLLRTICTLELIEYEQALRQLKALRAELMREKDPPTHVISWIDALALVGQCLIRSDEDQDLYAALQGSLFTEGMLGLPHHRILEAWVNLNTQGIKMIDFLKTRG